MVMRMVMVLMMVTMIVIMMMIIKNKSDVALKGNIRQAWKGH